MSSIISFSSIRFNNFSYGYHVSKLPSIFDTIDRVVKWNTITAMQIYLSNGRGYTFSLPDIKDLENARSRIQESSMWICAHSKLIHNPAGAKELDNEKFDEMMERTRSGIVNELDIISYIGGCGVVVHTGCCENRDIGIDNIVDTIIDVLTRITPFTKKLNSECVKRETAFSGSSNSSIGTEGSSAKGGIEMNRYVILENSAGEGSKIGGTLEDFVEIFQRLTSLRPDLVKQVGICIDTAHAFGAGLCDWGIPDEVEKFYNTFDSKIGLDKLKVFHLNDSRISKSKGLDAPFGSKKDRHSNLGLGYTFGTEERLEGLKKFFELAYQHAIPIIGEPPEKTDDTDNPGPGGIRDFIFIYDLLKDTPYPLHKITII